MNVIRQENGFCIEDKFLSDVTVNVQYKSGLCTVFTSFDRSYINSIVEYHPLIRSIVQGLLQGYNPQRPFGRKVPIEKMRQYLEKKLRPLLFSCWKEQKQLCNDTVVKLHQKAYREIGKVPIILSHELFSSNEHFVKDFLAYKSFAAFASLMLSYEGATHCQELLLSKGVDAHEYFHNGNYAKALKGNAHLELIDKARFHVKNITTRGIYSDFIIKNPDGKQRSAEIYNTEENGYWIDDPDSETTKQNREELDETIISGVKWLLENFFPKWRDVLSHTGKSYKSLNITLDNYPGNCGLNIMSLAKHNLTRPITRRREMLFYAITNDGFDAEIYAPIFPEMSKRTTDKEIVKALSIYNDYMEREHLRVYGNADNNDSKLSLRKNKSIYRMYLYLEDAYRLPAEVSHNRPDSVYNHKGRLPEMMRKAIRDHREYNQIKLPTYDADVELASPGFDVYVESPGKKKAVVTPLSTVGELIKESDLMQHCVRSYSQRCISGHSYIYHVEYNGHHATAEFDEDGCLRQIRGKRNTSNAATSFGEKHLKAKKRVTNNEQAQSVVTHESKIAEPFICNNAAVWQNGVVLFEGNFAG